MYKARLRALEGGRVSIKKPQGSETGTRELLGGTVGSSGVILINLSPRQINDFFFKKLTE